MERLLSTRAPAAGGRIVRVSFDAPAPQPMTKEALGVHDAMTPPHSLFPLPRDAGLPRV